MRVEADWNWLNYNILKSRTSGSSRRPLPLLLAVERGPGLESLEQTVHDALLVVGSVEVDERSLLGRSVRSLALLLLPGFSRPELLLCGLALLQDALVRLLQRFGKFIGRGPLGPSPG